MYKWKVKMKKEISNETIEYIGILSKLELNADEKIQASKDIEKMLEYFDKMSELSTENVEPMTHVASGDNVFRDDMVTNNNSREEFLRLAPEVSEGMFCAPKTFE